jgi:hypothetical protein
LSLQNLQQEKQESKTEISLYKGELTVSCLINNVAAIKKSFPTLPLDFYDIFMDRIKINKFSDERLTDAVAHVIDTCPYPTPTIAQFISFDKKVTVYKYPDIVQMVEDGDPKAFDRYKRIELEGLPEAVWIHVNDIAQYKIKSK